MTHSECLYYRQGMTHSECRYYRQGMTHSECLYYRQGMTHSECLYCSEYVCNLQGTADCNKFEQLLPHLQVSLQKVLHTRIAIRPLQAARLQTLAAEPQGCQILHNAKLATLIAKS